MIKNDIACPRCNKIHGIIYNIHAALDTYQYQNKCMAAASIIFLRDSSSLIVAKSICS